MFNRANKMTALLVAAAAVVSLVPATGVNAAEVKRISSEDGKVYHAQAYKDGNFYVDGEVNDKDEAAYYLADGKYNELENVDSNSEISIYGEKYVDVDGDYFVDLTNGKVTDDDVKEEAKDDAEVALRKKVKDKADDRYNNHDENVKLEEITSGNKFGETWYKTSYKSEGKTNGSTEATLNVYTDAKGNYIDADYNLGKIKVEVEKTSTAAADVKITDKNVTVENTDSNEKVATNGNEKIEVSAKITDAKVIAQDSKNIYRRATLTVSTNNADVVIKSVYGNTEIANKSNSVDLEVIQKISKEQSSDDVDGAKYAKSATTYVMVDEDGKVPSKDDINTFVNTMDSDSTTKYTVINGTLVAYKINSDGDLQVQAANLKSKAGLYYVDAHEDSAKGVETKDSYDVDADGNVWRIDGGFVYKFDNDDDWDKVYKVDGSMDRLSVYNKDNMVIWNEGDEVYSIIGNKEEKKDDDTKVEVKAGWNQAADGTWSFVNADGTKATGWKQDGANWYLLNDAGVMQTGWQNVAGTWYYLGSNGAMATGWQNLGGAWYKLADNGAMQTGWINDNGTWYFTDASGKMLANTTVNGYVLGANGAWVK